MGAGCSNPKKHLPKAETVQFIEMSGMTLMKVVSDNELSPDELAKVGVTDQSVVRVFTFEEDPSEGEDTEYATHPGQEVVYCAAGKVVVSVAGEETALGAGDSHTFDGQMMHGIRGWKGTVVISTVTPPIGPEVFGADPNER